MTAWGHAQRHSSPAPCVSVAGVDVSADSGCVWALLWTASIVLGMAWAALPCAQQDPCMCGEAVREALPGTQGWTCFLTAPLGLEVAFGECKEPLDSCTEQTPVANPWVLTWAIGRGCGST